MRRPMSVYRVDRAKGQVEFLYKVEGRGTRGMAMLAPGDDFNIAGPLGVGFKLQPDWKNIVVLGRGVGLATLAPLSQMAASEASGITRHLECAQPRSRDVARTVRRIRRADHHSRRFRRQQRGRKCREDSRKPGRCGQGGCVLHLWLQPAVEADADGSARSTTFPARSPSSRSWFADLAPATSACAPSRSTACGRSKRVCRDGPVFNMQEAVGW